MADLLRARDAVLLVPSDEGLSARLARAGGWPEGPMRRCVAAKLGLMLAEDLDCTIERVLLGPVGLGDARRRAVLPIRLEDGAPAALVDDPCDLDTLQWIAERLGAWPRLIWSDRPAIVSMIDRLNEVPAGTERAAGGNGHDSGGSHEISRETIEQAGSSVVRFVDDAILEAWRAGASDIHLETTRTGLEVKLRIDGVLVDGARFAGDRSVDEVLNRIKVLASLDVSETRIPQDGRFRARVAGRELDFRVSIMPSIFGEDAVIRLLDKAQLRGADRRIELPRLGFPDEVLAELRELSREPHGMLLVTGPTGSGKTTTLYAMLSEIHSGEQKIVTIEDPVEYELPRVLQIPVNERKGLTFAVGLRSILRHDPDTILVGEIRDRETAEIAVQAALTGHLVFTSVHANSAYDVVSRFMHMGVDLYAFMSALNGIVAQRLLRLNCPHCSAPYEDPRVAKQIGSVHVVDGGAQLVRGRGCAACRQTGYRGRVAIAEVLPVDERLRELVIDRQPASRLREQAQARGARSLRQRALALVAAGRTTIEEMQRVVGAND
jgi:general secretion pathway protein E